MMRYIMFYRPEHDAETAGPPSPAHMATMASYVDEMTRAGVLLATGGLAPTSKGVRVRRAGTKLTVTDGPFTEAKELVAGIAVLKGKPLAQMIEDTKHFLEVAGDGETEIRQLYDTSPEPRYLTLYRPQLDLENLRPPSPEYLAEMNKLIDEGMRSGAVLASEGLKASSRGALVRLFKGKATVTDGPFTEAKELICGYALVRTKSLAETIEHGKRFLGIAGDGLCEIRELYEASDFAA